MVEYFDQFTEWYAAIGYWALFLGVLLENAGIPVPGETALLIAGHLASPHGGSQLKLKTILLVGFLAAVIGDNLGYWLGRLVARRRLASGKRFLFLTPERFLRVERYFDRFGSATVFFGRFVAILRIAAGPSAGAAGMPWVRFLIANAAGAALWVNVIALLGYYAGTGWEALHHWLGRGAWGVAGLLAILAVSWWLYRWLNERRRERCQANAGLTHPIVAAFEMAPMNSTKSTAGPATPPI